MPDAWENGDSTGLRADLNGSGDGSVADTIGFLTWLGQFGRAEEASYSASAAGAEGLRFPRPFGRFQLLATLGAGTYGAVFRALDTELQRLVALKVAWPAVLMDPDASRRFVDEPITVAALDHPGIVKVYDSGSVDMARFIALELIEGPTLADWLKSQEQVSVRNAASVIRSVAEAVNCAHKQGVIHRDLKPRNILLRPCGESNVGFPYKPVVTDFGLARRSPRTDASAFTATVAILGTDRYMSPEQAAGQVGAVGAASDVFSLGVILYELVVGKRPFDGESGQQVRERIQQDEPPPIRPWRKGVPRDLETIILKCLEKAPGKRYETAADLAEDLGRFLDHAPILAKPASFAERAWKYVRRRPLAVSSVALAVCCVLSIAGLVGALVANSLAARREIAAANLAASVSEGIERQFQYASGIRRGAEALGRGGRREVLELLENSRALAYDPVRRGIEWDLLWEQVNDFDATLSAHDGAVHCVHFASSGDTLISAGEDGQVAVWDTATLKRRFQWNDAIGEVNVAQPSADGSLVAIAGDDGRVVVRQLADGRVVYDEQVVTGRIFALTWLGSKTEFAVGGEDAVLHIIAPLTGAHRRTNPLPTFPPRSSTDPTHPVEIAHLAYLPEQSKIAVAIEPGGVHVLDEASLTPTKTSAAELMARGQFCYLPIGPGYFAISSNASTISIRAISDGAVIAEIPERRVPRMLGFSRAAGVLVGAFHDGTVRTWDIESGVVCGRV